MSAVRLLWLVGIAVIAAIALLSVGRIGLGQDAPQAPPAEHGGQQCVLLRNGNVLVGQVRQEEDSYSVARDGATVYLAAYQVEAVGETLADLYTYRRKALPAGQAVPHLKLAEWCLQQGLLDQAAGEIAAAARLDPGHPRLEVVARRLEVASAPTVSSLSAPSTSENVHSAAVIAPMSPAPARPPADVGRVYLRELPGDAMEQFRRRVQPLLLNSCTTSGCHRSGGDESFLLDRRALWRDAPHTLTVQNLAETLRYVDAARPRESRLLQAAGSLHAPGLSSSPISAQSESYSVLEGWLLHVSGQDRPRDEAVAHEATDHAPPAARPTSVEPTEAELDALLADMEEDGSLVNRAVQRGIRRSASRHRDPFDPAEFNRRFSPREGDR